MPALLPLVFLAAALPAMPPAPIGEALPGYNKSPEAIIFEFTDYGGTRSTAKARVTPKSALDWCENWRAGTGENMQQCAKAMMEVEAGRVYEAAANCQTGDLWVDGKNYVFNGPDRSTTFFANYVSVRDKATGKQVGMSHAEGGTELGSKWLKLCPMGFPYDQVPVNATYEPGPDEVLIGELMGHNGSVVFHHEDRYIITYSSPRPSLEGVVAEKTVLFRGWHVQGEWFSGIAYAFKKNCAPAPYRVGGHLQGSLTLVLQGKAPVRHGCDIVGYSDETPNARLAFDLSPH